MHKNRDRITLIAAISTALLGLINLVSAFEYFALYGFNQSQAGIEILGFAYPVLLLVAAEFDYEKKGWALLLTLALCGLSITNSTITLREQLGFVLLLENWVLLIFSVVGAVASLAALSRMMNTGINTKNNQKK